jgi:hypothetical protein
MIQQKVIRNTQFPFPFFELFPSSKHIDMKNYRYSSFVELTACWDMDEIQHLLKGYYSLYQPQGCAFTFYTYGIDVMDELKFYPPSIEIYPTIALPSRS